MILEEIIQRETGLPRGRFELVKPNAVHLPTIKSAVIFYYAAWSPVPIMVLRRLGKILATYESNHPRFIVLNCDDFTPDYDTNLIPAHGWGEILWVKDGRIVASTPRHLPDEQMKSYTDSILPGN